MSLACLMINLDRSPCRLRSAQERFTASGIVFQRIPAIDGRLLTPHDMAGVDADAVLRSMGRTMLPGETAACMSHMRALRAFLDSGHPSCLIVEDDALPRAGALRQIKRALDHLEDHHSGSWNVLHCGDVKLRMCSREPHWIAGSGDPGLLRAHYFPMGAFALCWSRAGAQRFLQRHDRISSPFDNQVQNWLCRAGGGFALSPGAFSVTDAVSDIDGSAAWSRPIRGRTDRPIIKSLAKQRRLWTNRAFAAMNRLRALG